MWIEDVLKDIPEWAWAEIPMTFASSERIGALEITRECLPIGEVPEDIRPLFVKRMMLQNGAALVSLGVEFGEGVEPIDGPWCQEQANALSVLIRVSLKHAGIKLDDKTNYVIGEGWQILELPEQKILPADVPMMGLLARADFLMGGLMRPKNPYKT